MKDGSEPTIDATWHLSDANISAVGTTGEVFALSGLNLTIVEGRHIQLHPMDDDANEMREVWDYQLNFYVKDGDEPNNSRQSECRVGILGSLQDGRRLKIVGNGYVGRDDLGQIEGSFFSPPLMEIADPEESLTEWDRPG